MNAYELMEKIQDMAQRVNKTTDPVANMRAMDEYTDIANQLCEMTGCSVNTKVYNENGSNYIIGIEFNHLRLGVPDHVVS